MNLGLTISYIIAGMLLLSIAMMNIRVSGSSIELTMTQITREHVKNVAEILNDDIPNMGYDVDKKTDPVLTHANSNRIQFYRNIYNDPDRDPELITWEFFPGVGIGHTNNPDDRLLIRVQRDAATGVNDTTRIETGVTGFNLRYYSTHGDSLDNNMPSPGADATKLSSVRQIYLELEMQSTEPVFTGSSSTGRYIRSVYEKRYSPPNIEE